MLFLLLGTVFSWIIWTSLVLPSSDPNSDVLMTDVDVGLVLAINRDDAVPYSLLDAITKTLIKSLILRSSLMVPIFYIGVPTQWFLEEFWVSFTISLLTLF